MAKVSPAQIEDFVAKLDSFGAEITDSASKVSNILSTTQNIRNGAINDSLGELSSKLGKLNADWETIKGLVVSDLNKIKLGIEEEEARAAQTLSTNG